MSCPSLSCPEALKPIEYPKKCSAADYIKVKKDRAMTVKYLNTGYPTTYPNYAFRNDIRWGKAINTIECGDQCSNCGTWYVCNPKSNALVI
jgi:hypothetical protein